MLTHVKKLTACSLVGLGAFAGSWPTQEAPSPPPALDQYFAKALADWQVPGLAVAVVRNGSLLFAKGYGVRELGKPGRVDEHTAFDAASLTKSFTATAIAMLVDEKRMSWDAPVRTYIPELVLPDSYMTRHTTIRDLLAHRTGLQAGNFMWRFTGYDRAESLRRMRWLLPEVPFRTGMVYSNIGYTAAGEASARAAGTSWESLVRKRIIEPLGLGDTYLWSERGDHAGGNVASAHALIRHVHTVIDPTDGSAQREARTATAPAGAVQSSVWDLAIWMRFHLANGVLNGRRLVSEAAMEEMHAPHVVGPAPARFREARQLYFHPGYGMGWQVWDYRGHPMLWHSGSGNGQIAYMAILPRDRLGVVVLINSWRAPFLHGALVSRAIDHYLGFPARDYSGEGLTADSVAAARMREEMARDSMAHYDLTTSPHPVFTRPAAAYAGTYEDTLHGRLTISERQGKLTLQMGEGATADVEPWLSDTLLVRWHYPIYRDQFTTRIRFDTRGTPAAQSFLMVLNRDTVRAIRVRRTSRLH
jgi:CubicO group peptidase (beta-lactamase class C family)